MRTHRVSIEMDGTFSCIRNWDHVFVVAICSDGTVLFFSFNGIYSSKTASFSTPPHSILGLWLLCIFSSSLGHGFCTRKMHLKALQNDMALSPQYHPGWVRHCSA